MNEENPIIVEGFGPEILAETPAGVFAIRYQSDIRPSVAGFEVECEITRYRRSTSETVRGVAYWITDNKPTGRAERDPDIIELADGSTLEPLPAERERARRECV